MTDLRQLVTDLGRIVEKLERVAPAERSDSAGPLGTHKGLHHDMNIRVLLNHLTAMGAQGYAVKAPAHGQVEITYPSGSSVYLAYSQAVGEWVAIEHDEWGTE